MTSKSSRDILDWFRQFAFAKLSAEGVTLDISNMNIPLQNDQRVQAAIDWLSTQEANMIANWTPAMDDAWASVQDEVWAEIESTMPQNVRDAFDSLWGDADINALRLLKAISRTLSRLLCYYRNGGV